MAAQSEPSNGTESGVTESKLRSVEKIVDSVFGRLDVEWWKYRFSTSFNDCLDCAHPSAFELGGLESKGAPSHAPPSTARTAVASVAAGITGTKVVSMR